MLDERRERGFAFSPGFERWIIIGIERKDCSNRTIRCDKEWASMLSENQNQTYGNYHLYSQNRPYLGLPPFLHRQSRISLLPSVWQNVGVT